MNIEIRKASLNKIEELYRIESSCIQKPMTQKQLEDDITFERARYYVMAIDTEENKTVGLAGISLLFDHSDILTIAVLPEYRNLHIGSMLLKAIIEKTDNMLYEKMFLEVRESNTPAINMYKKYGFDEISIRKNYYTNNGENAIIMMKKI